MATPAFCNSAKVEMMQGGHCFNTTLSSLAGAGVNAAFTITGLASTAGISVGMAAGGTNVAAGAIVASIDSATQVTVSKAHTGTVTTGTISFTGDVFKILLIKVSPGRTFDKTQTNIGTTSGSPTTSNVGTDEMTNTSGTGYTAGGYQMVNVGPALSTDTATVSFSPNPNWTSATFSATAGIIYNSSTRQGAAATPLNGRTIGIYDFGGTQSVSAGTFTLVMPTNAAGSAVLQIA